MKRIYLIAIAAISLSACTASIQPPVGNTTPTPVATSGPVVIADKTVIDEKALYAAEALYNVPAKAYVVADTANKLTPAIMADLKPKLVAMYAALKVARAAYSVGNSSSFFEAVVQLRLLSAQVTAALPVAK